MHRRARRASAVSDPASLPAGRPSPPEWPRGARSRGGHGGPHGPRPRVTRGRRDATSEEAHAGARESVHRTGLARSLRNACNRRNTGARRGGRRRIEYAREPTHTVLLGDHYCMRIPMDAHRPDAVASRREHAAGETNEVSDGHRPAVAARSYRSRDLPAPEHPRLALATTGRRERPGGRASRLRR